MTPKRTVAAGIVAGCALLIAIACGGPPSADQLEWCAVNQADVGRSAAELALFDDQISFSEWKESQPHEYARACAHAFERASR